jgi:hypothetical protein
MQLSLLPLSVSRRKIFAAWREIFAAKSEIWG